MVQFCKMRNNYLFSSCTKKSNWLLKDRNIWDGLRVTSCKQKYEKVSFTLISMNFACHLIYGKAAKLAGDILCVFCISSPFIAAF